MGRTKRSVKRSVKRNTKRNTKRRNTKRNTKRRNTKRYTKRRNKLGGTTGFTGFTVPGSGEGVETTPSVSRSGMEGETTTSAGKQKGSVFSVFRGLPSRAIKAITDRPSPEPSLTPPPEPTRDVKIKGGQLMEQMRLAGLNKLIIKRIIELYLKNNVSDKDIIKSIGCIASFMVEFKRFLETNKHKLDSAEDHISKLVEASKSIDNLMTYTNVHMKQLDFVLEGNLNTKLQSFYTYVSELP
jgi:hypothetical protein